MIKFSIIKIYLPYKKSVEKLVKLKCKMCCLAYTYRVELFFFFTSFGRQRLLSLLFVYKIILVADFTTVPVQCTLLYNYMVPGFWTMLWILCKSDPAQRWPKTTTAIKLGKFWICIRLWGLIKMEKWDPELNRNVSDPSHWNLLFITLEKVKTPYVVINCCRLSLLILI